MTLFYVKCRMCATINMNPNNLCSLKQKKQVLCGVGNFGNSKKRWSAYLRRKAKINRS